MNIFINSVTRTAWLVRGKAWLDRHLAVKQWLWFVGLWLGGLAAAVVLMYPFKILIRLVG